MTKFEHYKNIYMNFMSKNELTVLEFFGENYEKGIKDIFNLKEIENCNEGIIINE